MGTWAKEALIKQNQYACIKNQEAWLKNQKHDHQESRRIKKHSSSASIIRRFKMKLKFQLVLILLLILTNITNSFGFHLNRAIFMLDETITPLSISDEKILGRFHKRSLAIGRYHYRLRRNGYRGQNHATPKIFIDYKRIGWEIQSEYGSWFLTDFVK